MHYCTLTSGRMACAVAEAERCRRRGHEDHGDPEEECAKQQCKTVHTHTATQAAKACRHCRAMASATVNDVPTQHPARG